MHANGQRFFVVANGDPESPPVVCIPGALGTAESDFYYQLEGLAHQHRVIAFDPRGYGNSRPPVRDFPVDFYYRDAEDAHAIMQSLGHESYSVIGWSDGANSGTILAATKVEAVQKFVTFGGNAWLEKGDVDGFETYRDVNTWSKRMLGALLPVYGDDLQTMWGANLDTMQKLLENGGDVCQEHAKRIQCPTFVLAGQLDPITRYAHPKWFHENIPGARLHVFPEGKHNIHQKYAEEFNRLVLRFLAE